MLTRLVNSRLWQSRPTFWWEYLAASTYLTCVVAFTTDWTNTRMAAGQVISAFAVMGTFGHMSVGSRLEEAQDRSDVKTVECYRKLSYYLVAKESLWLVAFTLLHAWTAIAGIPLFLFYPAWRRLYRRLRSPQPGQNPTQPEAPK